MVVVMEPLLQHQQKVMELVEQLILAEAVVAVQEVLHNIMVVLVVLVLL
jgi:hypothetical protein